MSLPFALALVFLSGFVSLSSEILWFRAYSVVSRASPLAFGVVLGAFPLGLALGSLGSRRYCRTQRPGPDPRHLRALAAFQLGANLLGVCVVPVLAAMAPTMTWGWSLPLVAAAAGAMGVTLPLVSHFGIAPDERAGQRLSWLYMSNILGSTAGSLSTGFLALEHLGLPGTATALGALSLGLTAALVWVAGYPPGPRMGRAGAVLALAAGVGIAGPTLYDGVYERLVLRETYQSGERFVWSLENRHGHIAVRADGTVYGGGAYDGVISTDLVHDRNWIARAYALAAVHPSPRHILVVGLSAGPWTQVLAHLPGVEKVTVVEINPGYLELVRRSPEVASLLDNPRVELVFDDGRRWLQRHPAVRFDAIVQNTTWHWRGSITNLLSREYLELCRTRLAPGGILAYNTTWSEDAQRTGAVVFPHALRLFNLMFVSDSPFTFDGDRWRRALLDWRIDGRPVFDPSREADAAKLAWLTALPATLEAPGGAFVQEALESRASILARTAAFDVITDDNMRSEFRAVAAW